MYIYIVAKAFERKIALNLWHNRPLYDFPHASAISQLNSVDMDEFCLFVSFFLLLLMLLLHQHYHHYHRHHHQHHQHFLLLLLPRFNFFFFLVSFFLFSLDIWFDLVFGDAQCLKTQRACVCALSVPVRCKIRNSLK